MWVRKWSIKHMSKWNIHFEPKIKNKWNHEICPTPNGPPILWNVTFCLGFFKFTNTIVVKY